MLEIKNMNKSFNVGTVNEKKVISELSITVNDGDFITIIGSNGAGKSTLLNLIAGTYAPDSGKMLLDGEDITYKTEIQKAKYIGRVFQDPMMGTAADMWIEENLALAYRRTKRRVSYSFLHSLIKRLDSNIYRRTETESIKVLNLTRNNHQVIDSFIIDQQLSISVIYLSPRWILCDITKCIVIRRGLI